MGDDSDGGDEDTANRSPNTTRKLLVEKENKSIKKLGTCATYMTLLKGFVNVAVLVLPKSFYNGGYAF